MAPDPAPGSLRCPRCRTQQLFKRPVRRLFVHSCPDCEGLWIETDVFEHLVDRQARRFGFTPCAERARAVSNEDSAGPDLFVCCPRCSEHMTRLNFAHVSGVIVDECAKHGIWLDQGELRKIADFVAAGGLRDIRDLDVASPAFRTRANRECAPKHSDTARKSAGTSWPTIEWGSPDAGDIVDFLLFLLYCILRIAH
ncbi:MAG: zf-TFIIB domain-containing protein [Acidobacteriota bacterium]